jgi:hypothetical protein
MAADLCESQVGIISARHNYALRKSDWMLAVSLLCISLCGHFISPVDRVVVNLNCVNLTLSYPFNVPKMYTKSVPFGTFEVNSGGNSPSQWNVYLLVLLATVKKHKARLVSSAGLVLMFTEERCLLIE